MKFKITNHSVEDLIPDDQMHLYFTIAEALHRLEVQDRPGESARRQALLLDGIREVCKEFEIDRAKYGDELREPPRLCPIPTLHDCYTDAWRIFFKCENNGNTYRYDLVI